MEKLRMIANTKYNERPVNKLVRLQCRSNVANIVFLSVNKLVSLFSQSSSAD